jgi:hypothetical protein
MRRPILRVSFGLGILGLVAAGTAAAFLAFASGGNAAGNNACTQLNTQANCLFVSSVPSVLSANKIGLIVVRFKNIFANATATHTVTTATLPAGALVSAVSASTSNASCSQPPFTQTVSCSFGSVPGGSIVSMYVRFTTSLSAGQQLDPVHGTVTFAEGNGGTNDTFFTDSGTTAIVGDISPNGQGGAQGGLCTSTLSQTGFTTTFTSTTTDPNNGQQAKIGNLPFAAPGLPCTPVSAGVRVPTAAEANACGGSCPANTAFVFFPVLADNAAAVLTLNYPTKPPGVTAVKNAPLFEFLPDGLGGLQKVQLVKCGVTPNPSPDSCLVGDPTKFGSQGVSFTVSVTGSELDGSYVP